MDLRLTATTTSDLDDLYRIQLDPDGRHAAAFVSQMDQGAYLEKYTRHLADPTITMFTVRVEGTIVGSVAQFEMEGDAEVTYWIDRDWWGRGIATRALDELVRRVVTRPLFARAAVDNLRSRRVLERCGFVQVGTDRGFAPARGFEIDELVYRLD